MTTDSGGVWGKTSILIISIIALFVTLCNGGVWIACVVEYCDIYNQTDINGEWEIAILWYTPPVVALVLMLVPSIFGICMGSVCYDSAVGIAIAVFSTLSVIGSFVYICLELLALFGHKEDIYSGIFNRSLVLEGETGELLWWIQLGLTCFMLIITMCLIIIGYCSCTKIDEEEIDHVKEREEGFPNDPGYGQFDSCHAPYVISKAPSSIPHHHSDANEFQTDVDDVSNRYKRYNNDLIADHLRPFSQATHAPHQDPWSRQPTFTTRQEQHAESMESKYARYGAQPAVGPPISRSSSTRRSQQELPTRRQEPQPYIDPGPPQEPYIVDGSEPFFLPSNHRQRRPKHKGNSSILEYGKKSNYTGIRDIHSQMTNGLPRPQVDYDYSQDNRSFTNSRYDYY